MVVLTRLQKDAEGFGLGAPDRGGQRVRALQRHERANKAEHAVEHIGTVPGRDERPDGAGADAGNRMVIRVRGKVHFLPHRGNQFVFEEVREAVADVVVFEDALIAALGVVGESRQDARVDEDTNQRRQVAFGDQIVEHHGHTLSVPQSSATIQIDHERRGFGGIVLRRHIDRVSVRHARIVLTRRERVPGHDTLRHVRLRL